MLPHPLHRRQGSLSLLPPPLAEEPTDATDHRGRTSKNTADRPRTVMLARFHRRILTAILPTSPGDYFVLLILIWMCSFFILIGTGTSFPVGGDDRLTFLLVGVITMSHAYVLYQLFASLASIYLRPKSQLLGILQRVLLGLAALVGGCLILVGFALL